MPENEWKAGEIRDGILFAGRTTYHCVNCGCVMFGSRFHDVHRAVCPGRPESVVRYRASYTSAETREWAEKHWPTPPDATPVLAQVMHERRLAFIWGTEWADAANRMAETEQQECRS